MKTLATTVLILALLINANAQFNFFDWSKNSDKFWDQNSSQRDASGSGYRQYLRVKAYSEPRIDVRGHQNPEKYYL